MRYHWIGNRRTGKDQGRRPARFCPKQTVVLTIQFSSMEHDAFHVPYLLDTTPEAAFHGQAVKTVAYLRVSTTQQVLGPEARTPEGLAGRLTARWQGGRNPALPRTGRFQDRHRQVWACPVPPSTAHEHPRAQAEPLACISTRILSVPYHRRTSGAKCWPWRGPRMTAWTCRWEMAKWPDSLRA